MKILVALALAVHVSSSATDGPEKQVQLPLEKPDPEPVEPQCVPTAEENFDCDLYSESCQRSSCSSGEKKNFGDRLSREECEAKEAEARANEDVSDPDDPFRYIGYKWCQGEPRARCTNGNQCIIRQDKNGKLIRKQKSTADCKDRTLNLYDCPTYASLLGDCPANVGECAPLYDCAPFSSVCLVFDKESCLVNEDTSLTTKEECEAKNDEDSGFVGGTAQWCPEASV